MGIREKQLGPVTVSVITSLEMYAVPPDPYSSTVTVPALPLAVIAEGGGSDKADRRNDVESVAGNGVEVHADVPSSGRDAVSVSPFWIGLMESPEKVAIPAVETATPVVVPESVGLEAVMLITSARWRPDGNSTFGFIKLHSRSGSDGRTGNAVRGLRGKRSGIIRLRRAGVDIAVECAGVTVPRASVTVAVPLQVMVEPAPMWPVFPARNRGLPGSGIIVCNCVA